MGRCGRIGEVRTLEKGDSTDPQADASPIDSRRPWKGFIYFAFTTWALEWALIKSGLNTPEDFKLP